MSKCQGSDTGILSPNEVFELGFCIANLIDLCIVCYTDNDFKFLTKSVQISYFCSLNVLYVPKFLSFIIIFAS